MVLNLTPQKNDMVKKQHTPNQLEWKRLQRNARATVRRLQKKGYDVNFNDLTISKIPPRVTKNMLKEIESKTRRELSSKATMGGRTKREIDRENYENKREVKRKKKAHKKAMKRYSVELVERLKKDISTIENVRLREVLLRNIMVEEQKKGFYELVKRNYDELMDAFYGIIYSSDRSVIENDYARFLSIITRNNASVEDMETVSDVDYLFENFDEYYDYGGIE